MECDSAVVKLALHVCEVLRLILEVGKRETIFFYKIHCYLKLKKSKSKSKKIPCVAKSGIIYLVHLL